MLAALAIGVCAVAQSVDAQAQSLGLAVHGQPEAPLCPDADELRMLVEGRMGYDAFEVLEVKADVTYALSGDMVSARLTTKAGQRDFKADTLSCKDLSEEIVLSLVLYLEELKEAQDKDARNETPPKQRPPPVAPRVDDTAKKISAPEPDRFQGVIIGVSPMLALGRAPGPAFGAMIEAHLVWRYFTLGVAGGVDFEQDRAVEELVAGAASPGRVRTQLAEGSLFLCGLVQAARRFRLQPCAFMSLGAFISAGAKFDQVMRNTDWYGAAGVGAVFDIPITAHFLVGFGADLGYQIARTTVFANDEELWRMPDFMFRLRLRLAWSSASFGVRRKKLSLTASERDGSAGASAIPFGRGPMPGPGASARMEQKRTERRQRAEDDAYFAQIYASELSFVWNLVRRFGVPQEHMEDVAQDVFMVVYRKLGEFDRSRSIRSWLYGIAYRTSLSSFRKEGRHAHGELEEDALVAAGDDGETKIGRQEDDEVVRKAISTIPPDRRGVFVLHELEERTMPEISAALDLKLNTAYSRLRLARRDFRVACQDLGLIPAEART